MRLRDRMGLTVVHNLSEIQTMRSVPVRPLFPLPEE